MSSDGECMRKPCKRRNVIISGTESSDDSIIVPAHRKRKVYRVVSEAESSDDDSDVPKPVIRRKNHRVVSEDDGSGSDSSDNDESYQTESDDSADWQSDWDSSDESQKPAKSESSMKCKKEKDLSAGKTADFESDTSDGQSEKCPICLLPFRTQEVGNPAACEHCFCLECIIEWSKNINTCPVDRQTFTTIHVRDKLGGKVIKQLPVEVKPRLEDQIQEDPTFCEICNLSDREDRMLLCDGCDSGYHLECLTPPMNEVPMDEWFCPECSQNSQNDAEAVDIDLDEIPDLMEEARRLGISYGRTRTGIPRETGPARVIPRTRQTERVRANIRADRNRNRAREVQEHEGNQLRNVTIDFDQPSTSSGFDSIGENSRSRSPETSNNSRSTGRRPSQKARKKGSSTRKSKKKRKTRKREGSVLREVRIVELNQDGQEEEIVTYVKISQNSRTKRKRRRKGRKKRRARTVSSVLKRTKTVKRRLATALGVNVTERQLSHVAPIIANGKQTIPERSALINARYNAGITQVSLFGNNLGLDYSPPGSDEEQDCPTGNGGIVTGIQRRSAIPSTRRRLALKNGIINPSLDADTQSSVTDLIGSILSSQELWHSKKKSEVTLKADGTILVKNKDNNDNKHSINNNESPIKKNELIKSTSTPITVEQESAIPANETPLDLSAVSSQNITQAPMYNSGPRGGGGGNRGNFRGGYNRDNRHSYGGNGSQNYRDNYSNNGRHSYGGGSGGGGGNPRDNSFPGSRDFNTNYNPNFEHCGLPPQQPPFANNQMPFRNRNPQHFRNRFTLNPFQNDRGGPHGNVFHHPPHHTPPRPRNPPPNIAIPPSVPGPSQNVPFNNQGTELISNNFEAINFPEENNTNPSEFIAESNSGNEKTGNNDEECDIYCDIDQPSNNKDSNVEDDNQTTLLPPPEPPSELLDFEENSKSSDKDSDQELVIDDTPKEEHNPSAVANRDLKPEDKYDPFENESDSNDSGRNKEKNTEKRVEETTEAIPIPLDPPPSPPNFLLTSTSSGSMQKAATGASAPSTSSTIRLTAYDDDDEDDSQSDCPNFSVYSSETMDVARHTEQELSQQIGPLEPPPLPPEIPDDDDVILGDVQTTDLTDIPEPSDPYVESLRKERQALSKIPPKKITSHDTRGKITFKIGNKFKLNNKLSNLYDELDENIEITIEQEKEAEAKRNSSSSTSKTAIGSSSSSNINNNEKEKLNESEKDEKVPNEVEEDAKNAFSGNKKDTNSAIFESKMETEEKIVPEELEVNIEKSTIDLTEKSSDTIISIADTIASSSSKLETEKSNDNEINDEDDAKLNKKAKTKEKEDAGMEIEADVEEDDEDLEEKELNQSDELKNDESGEKMVSPTFESDEETENFPLEKDKIEVEAAVVTGTTQPNWDSDGAYTPCRDELPIKEKHNKTPTPTFESGLEPITPTRDKTNDDLDGCRTPAAYAGLGTEAISETDEAMNFEDELTLLSLRKDKEMEEGEIMEDKAPKKGATEKSKEKDDEKKKKKKDKKEKKDSTEKNKENISSDNQVAWKKISKSTKDRPYRDKDRRSRSKDNKKKKNKEPVKKKEKRKELPRYDVRKIVADKPPRPRKDEYGRDIREKSRSRSRSKSFSRKRSFSRDRKSRSYSHGRSRSRTRSRSRLRRSWSRDRRSYSKTYRSLSRRRSLSRKRKSPRRNSSVSRTRRSVSRKRSVSPRRRSLSRKRRSLSPRRRSRRSLSRHRSPKHRSKSRERDHRVKKDKVKKHNKSRSRSRNNRKRSKSKTRDKKHTKRKPVASRSRSKERSVSRERNRNWAGNAAAGSEHLNEKNVGEHFIRDREESWSAQWTPSWSRSRSKTPPLNHQTDIDARGGGWSPQPVLDSVTVPPKNLTVILTNKEAIKKKKKEKRKENKKPKDVERRRRGRRVRTPPPSKEVFASGDNILVSVCFNKENETAQTGIPELPETIPLLATTKRRRRDTIPTSTSTTAATAIQSEQPPLKRPKKDKVKDKRSKSPKVKKDKKKKSKAAEIAATKKPVAVIDLDQSPFREQTPSPRDVIVLSDDDDKQAQEIATPDQHPSHESPPRDGQFVSQGPKTPPEPQLTYSNQQTNLRPQINPINEEDEEEEEELDERADEELELRAQEELELRLKIGPNTPPEPPSSPPTSPDAYDPFDPTKSRSPTPDVNQEANLCDERNQRTSPSNNNNVPETSAINESAQQQEQTTPEKPSEKPKIISMVTIKRAASPQRDTSPSNDQAQTEVSQPNESPSKAQSNQTNTQSASNPFATINPVLATVAAAVQRSTIFASSTPLNAQRNLLQANRISPSNQIKQRTNDRPQLPNIFTNSTKQTITTTTTTIRTSKTLQNKNSSTLGQNGSDATIDITNDNVIDMSSPYSPGSSMSDGIFDPPSPANYNNSPVVGTATTTATSVSTANNKTNQPKKSADKKPADAFDALFGSSPVMRNIISTKTSSRKKTTDKKKKSTNPKVGVRMDENQLQILDDLPSSAVEMQVKDKFLKKLNRQERVVEEVKLVLKPHYTKKHVTKDEYKDIMRKAVPKICHNKTGEINPKKIAQLIEAYVRKCRNKKKVPSSTATSTTNATSKASKPVKRLWS